MDTPRRKPSASPWSSWSRRGDRDARAEEMGNASRHPGTSSSAGKLGVELSGQRKGGEGFPHGAVAHGPGAPEVGSSSWPPSATRPSGTASRPASSRRRSWPLAGQSSSRRGRTRLNNPCPSSRTTSRSSSRDIRDDLGRRPTRPPSDRTSGSSSAAPARGVKPAADIVQGLRDFALESTARRDRPDGYPSGDHGQPGVPARLRLDRLHIEVDRQFGELPPVSRALLARMNQLFFELLNNAIQAIEATSRARRAGSRSARLRRRETSWSRRKADRRRLRHPRRGSTPDLRDPFFTTRPVGRGRAGPEHQPRRRRGPRRPGSRWRAAPGKGTRPPRRPARWGLPPSDWPSSPLTVRVAVVFADETTSHPAVRLRAREASDGLARGDHRPGRFCIPGPTTWLPLGLDDGRRSRPDRRGSGTSRRASGSRGVRADRPAPG